MGQHKHNLNCQLAKECDYEKRGKMNELKPCPLCGNEVSLDREDIFCDFCHLVLRFDDYIYCGEAKDLKEAREMGIEAWNTRAGEQA